MNIQIDDTTVESIKAMMKEQDIYTLRIDYAVNSWSTLNFEPVLDVQNDKDLVFYYKDIKIIAATQVELIVSKIIISHENTSSSTKLKLKWE